MAKSKKAAPTAAQIEEWKALITAKKFDSINRFCTAVGRDYNAVKKYLPAEYWSILREGSVALGMTGDEPEEPAGVTEESAESVETPDEPVEEDTEEPLIPAPPRRPVIHLPPPSTHAQRAVQAPSWSPADMARGEASFQRDMVNDMTEALAAFGYEKKAPMVISTWIEPPFADAINDPAWLKIVLDRYQVPTTKVRGIVHSFFKQLRPDELQTVMVETEATFYDRYDNAVEDSARRPLRPNRLPMRGNRPVEELPSGDPELDALYNAQMKEEVREVRLAQMQTAQAERALRVEEKKRRLGSSGGGDPEMMKTVIDLLKDRNQPQQQTDPLKMLEMVERIRAGGSGGDAEKRMQERLDRIEQEARDERERHRAEIEQVRRERWETEMAYQKQRLEEIAQTPDLITRLSEDLEHLKRIPGIDIGGGTGDKEYDFAVRRLDARSRNVSEMRQDFGPLLAVYLENRMRIDNLILLKNTFPEIHPSELLQFASSIGSAPRRQALTSTTQPSQDGACLGCGSIGKPGLYNPESLEGWCDDCTSTVSNARHKGAERPTPRPNAPIAPLAPIPPIDVKPPVVDDDGEEIRVFPDEGVNPDGYSSDGSRMVPLDLGPPMPEPDVKPIPPPEPPTPTLEPEPEAEQALPICKAQTKRGVRCKNVAISGDFCPRHSK